MSTVSRMLTVALVASSACASPGVATRGELNLPYVVTAATRGATRSTDSEVAVATIRIENGTTGSYRVSIAFDGLERMLGSVGGQEAHDFIIDRQWILGHRDFQLVVTERDGTRRRESEHFLLDNVRVVKWVVDARLVPSVTLR